jgi:hypothetical protein
MSNDAHTLTIEDILSRSTDDIGSGMTVDRANVVLGSDFMQGRVCQLREEADSAYKATATEL